MEARHLDETSPGSFRKSIIPQMHAIDYDSSLAMFLFVSPQYLARYPLLINALLECHAKQRIRFVVIDEASLHAEHRRLFQDATRVPIAIFFMLYLRLKYGIHCSLQ